MKTQPKISLNTHQFWKNPKFSKKPKTKVSKHEMHEEWEISSSPSVEKLEKAWRNLKEEVWNERKSVWEMNRRGQIERDRRNERRIAKDVKIEPSVMLDRWGIERCWGSCWEKVVDSWGIEKVSRNKKSDLRTEARSIHQVSRSYRGGRSILDWSTRY